MLHYSLKHFKPFAVMKCTFDAVLPFIFLGTILFSGISGQRDVFGGNGIDYVGCEADSDPCILTCKFVKQDASIANISWENEDGAINDDTVTYEYYNLTNSIQLISTLTLTNNGNYTCIVYNISTGNNNNSDAYVYHTFHISGNQSSPKVTTQSYNISGTGNCNVTFTCIIQANPKPTIFWVKKVIKNDTFHLISNDNNWMISTETPDEYEAGLLISNYSYDTDGGSYRCIAITDNGIAESEPLIPHIKPGKPTANQTTIIFKPGDTIYLNCTSSGGFPAPIITWEFLSGPHQTDVQYNGVDNGQSVSFLAAIAEWDDDKGFLRCNIEDPITNIINSTDISFYITDTPFMVSTNSCSPLNFTDGSSCTLECEAFSKSYFVGEWIYRFSPWTTREPYYPLTSRSYERPGRYSTSITLEDYWAGVYTCILWTNGQNLSNTFHIEEVPMDGSPIGGFCLDRHECGALNSICTGGIQHRCQCPEDYPVFLNENNMFTAACLEAVDPGGTCLTTGQCQAAAENYVCPLSDSFSEYGTCQCIDPYFRTYIQETGLWQCILKAGYLEACTYDSQCYWADIDMICYPSGYCDCQDGYYYSTTIGLCQYDAMANYMSAAAMVGIVISIIVLIVIIFVLAMIYIRSSAITTRRRYEQTTAMRQTSRSFPPNVMQSENNSAVPPHPTDFPPTYFEAQRSETPPPPFDSVAEIKLDDDVEGQSGIIITSEHDLSRSSINLNEETAESSGHSNPAYDAEC